MNKNKGFSLIEMLLVVAVISIVAALAVPGFVNYWEMAQVSGLAGNLRTFGKGFQTYAVVNGKYPTDWHLNGPYNLPPGMENFLAADIWAAETALGGNYNWEGPNNYPYAGISIYAIPAREELMVLLDQMMDDGDLTQGNFRKTPNGRYTFIIEE